MSEIRSNQLALVRQDSPLPTVEVDLDSAQESDSTFDDILADEMKVYAAKNTTVTATLYYYYTSSINFGEPTNSVFIGLAGPERCLKVILSAMKGTRGIRARFSDYISPYNAAAMIHIEAGKVYRAEDPMTWYTTDTKSTPAETQVASGDTKLEPTDDRESEPEPDAAGGSARGSVPSRYRRARADATVGTIRKTMEEIFGLPEGSVALCGPDGNPLRATAKIATLRKRWE